MPSLARDDLTNLEARTSSRVQDRTSPDVEGSPKLLDPDVRIMEQLQCGAAEKSDNDTALCRGLEAEQNSSTHGLCSSMQMKASVSDLRRHVVNEVSRIDLQLSVVEEKQRGFLYTLDHITESVMSTMHREVEAQIEEVRARTAATVLGCRNQYEAEQLALKVKFHNLSQGLEARFENLEEDLFEKAGRRHLGTDDVESVALLEPRIKSDLDRAFREQHAKVDERITMLIDDFEAKQQRMSEQLQRSFESVMRLAEHESENRSALEESERRQSEELTKLGSALAAVNKRLTDERLLQVRTQDPGCDGDALLEIVCADTVHMEMKANSDHRREQLVKLRATDGSLEEKNHAMLSEFLQSITASVRGVESSLREDLMRLRQEFSVSERKKADVIAALQRTVDERCCDLEAKAVGTDIMRQLSLRSDAAQASTTPMEQVVREAEGIAVALRSELKRDCASLSQELAHERQERLRMMEVVQNMSIVATTADSNTESLSQNAIAAECAEDCREQRRAAEVVIQNLSQELRGQITRLTDAVLAQHLFLRELTPNMEHHVATNMRLGQDLNNLRTKVEEMALWMTQVHATEDSKRRELSLKHVAAPAVVQKSRANTELTLVDGCAMVPSAERSTSSLESWQTGLLCHRKSELASGFSPDEAVVSLASRPSEDASSSVDSERKVGAADPQQTTMTSLPEWTAKTLGLNLPLSSKTNLHGTADILKQLGTQSSAEMHELFASNKFENSNPSLPQASCRVVHASPAAGRRIHLVERKQRSVSPLMRRSSSPLRSSATAQNSCPAGSQTVTVPAVLRRLPDVRGALDHLRRRPT